MCVTRGEEKREKEECCKWFKESIPCILTLTIFEYNNFWNRYLLSAIHFTVISWSISITIFLQILDTIMYSEKELFHCNILLRTTSKYNSTCFSCKFNSILSLCYISSSTTLYNKKLSCWTPKLLLLQENINYKTQHKQSEMMRCKRWHHHHRTTRN